MDFTRGDMDYIVTAGILIIGATLIADKRK